MGQSGWTPVAADSGGWTPVVYEKQAAVADVPRDARGMPAVSSNVSEQREPPSGLAEMLGPLAHPQTLTDFARILVLPVDSVRRAFASAMTAAAARQAANAAPSTVGNAMATAGRGMERAGAAIEKPLTTAGIVDAVTASNPVRGAAIVAAPKVVQFAGRGLQRAGNALAAERTVAPVVAEAAPVAAAPVATPTAPPVAPPPGNGWPNQKLLNELAIMARRAKVRLTPETEQAAIDLVERTGITPAEAVAKVTTASPAATAVAEAAPVAGKVRLTAAESKDYIEMIKQGKTRKTAMEAIEAGRAFRDRFGLKTPTAAETRFPKGMRGKATPQ